MKALLKKLTTPFGIIIIFSSARLLLHLYTNAFAGYGYFRDELYYLASTDRLDIGYVDHPPFSIYMLWISGMIFGDSIFALRLLPAICAGALVFLTGKITLIFNGGRTALLVALSCVSLAPVSVGMHSTFSMNCFDWLFWSLSFYFIILLFSTQQKKYWYWLGLIMGLGLLNKTGFLWAGAGFFIALLVSERKSLLTIYPYITAAIALLIFSPYIIWNFMHDFAHQEFISNAVKMKYGELTLMDFISGQFLLQNPITFPIWIGGLIYILKSKEQWMKIPGIIYISVFLILLINLQSKAGYLSPLYPLLFAAGGTVYEKLSVKYFNHRLRYVYIILIIVTGLLLVPTAAPILPVEDFISYSETLGIQEESQEGLKLDKLPQHFADMFGWEEMAEAISEIYLSLPDEQRENTFVFANNYGEAGAIDFFRDKYPLPEVFCPHNSYWIWKNDDLNNFDYQNVIIIGGRIEDYSENLLRVEEVKRIDTPYAIPYETNLPIYYARGFKTDIRELWKQIKLYI